MALSQTPASVIPSANAVIERITAGATITAGMPYYQSTTDLKAYPCDGTATTESDANTAKTKARGIAASSVAAGQPLSGVRYDPALPLGATLVKGQIYCLDHSGVGAITTSPDVLDNLPHYHKAICQAISTTTVHLDLREPSVGVHMASA